MLTFKIWLAATATLGAAALPCSAQYAADPVMQNSAAQADTAQTETPPLRGLDGQTPYYMGVPNQPAPNFNTVKTKVSKKHKNSMVNTTVGLPADAARGTAGAVDKSARVGVGMTDRAAKTGAGLTDRAVKTTLGVPYKGMKEVFKTIF